MMNCIRCGAEVHLDGRLLVTDAGGYTCPAAMLGEASVHRVQAAPVVQPKVPRQWGPTLMRGALGAFLGWETGKLLFGGSHNPSDDREQAGIQAAQIQYLQAMNGQPNPQGANYVQQAAGYISGR